MIRRLFDLSLRQKIPLWGAGLIIFSTLSVSAALMYRSYDNLKGALVTSSTGLGQTLSKTLVPTLLHDNVWRAFEIIRAPFSETVSRSGVRPKTIFVIGPDRRIFVSSDPVRFPMLSDITDHGADFRAIFKHVPESGLTRTAVFEPKKSQYLFVAVPINDGGLNLGTLLLRHSRADLDASFLKTASGGAVWGVLILAILLPLNWYWGRRMAVPLLELAARMENIENAPPARLDAKIYGYRDELGRMFEAYNSMVDVLQEKAALERGIISSERLAAMGRLTAGIAHEINNPLSGMLTALDTLKRRGDINARTGRTFAIIERGLLQIRDTVGALLIEARPQKRWLEDCDLEDVQTLLRHEITKEHVNFLFEAALPGRLPFPAGAVRQILINLLQNAAKAARTQEDAWVRASVAVIDKTLEIRVRNSGEAIPPERLERLFEPFVSFQEGGHGLGLWVTYQLVRQLGGRIDATCNDGEVEFVVRLALPKGENIENKENA